MDVDGVSLIIVVEHEMPEQEGAVPWRPAEPSQEEPEQRRWRDRRGIKRWC
jgi:hypothetical protein